MGKSIWKEGVYKEIYTYKGTYRNIPYYLQTDCQF